MTDEELIARLRKFGELWPDDHAAADRIEALVKERDEAKRLMQARHREMLAADGLMRKHQRRAERMEAAADYILDGMGIDAPNYEIDPDDDFLDAANSRWVRDTLTRLAEAMRGNDDTR